MITKIKTPSYCYRYSFTYDKLCHFYSCEDDESKPDISAWENIDEAVYFDVKLLDTATVSDYEEVLSRIRAISKKKYIWLHFSNETKQCMTYKTEKLFWDVLDIFYDGQDFALELHRKLCKGEAEELTTLDKEFFQRVKNWTIQENLKYVTLAVERKSSGSIDFFRKY